MALWTFKDQIQALRDYVGNTVGGNIEGRRIKRAIHDALRDLASQRAWSYYVGLRQLTVSASQTSSTITYDHTGGTYERMVTLASGTWPSWAALGYIVISNVPYKVATRESDTVVTLSVHSNPGADVAAGTSYTMYRDLYPLPDGFISLQSLVSLGNQWPLTPLASRDFANRERISVTPASPCHYSIMGDPNYQGRVALRLSPPPNAADTLEYLYTRQPRMPSLEEYSTGTVSVTSGSRTVTGSGTTFDASMVGCSIRIGDDGTSLPTGPDGSNYYAVERVVTGYTSATVITVDSAFSTTISARTFVISDILDLDQAVMLNAFQRGCEMLLASGLNMPKRDSARTYYEQELLRAMEADSRIRELEAAGEISGRRYTYPDPYETGP